jgi:hypothetical protein
MKQKIWDFLYRFFPSHGHHLMPSAVLYDWQKDQALGQGLVRLDGPGENDNQLLPHDPRLLDLRKRYAEFDSQATTRSSGIRDM